MRKINVLLCASVGTALLAGCTGTNVPNRERNFSLGWLFSLGALEGAEAPDYDDATWTTVDLPHDFALIPLPGGDTDDQVGPFTKQSEGINQTGHFKGGTGWYRKTFTVAAADAGKVHTLVIDGAYMETDVWVNGQKVGDNKHGYTPFALDLTPALRPAGEPNVVAIRVENNGKNSRWYSGSGLYREVKMLVTNPVHVDTWGAYLTTTAISPEQATLAARVTLKNDSEQDATADVTVDILTATGTKVATATEQVTLPAASSAIVKQPLTVASPALWSPDSPTLYTAQITVKQDGATVDTYAQPFGIRTIEVSADQGFLLNGQPILLKGGCLHHDNGFLGAAAFRRAEYRRVELMKANGYNAIRSSHYPPSEHFLQACDELGVMIIDEFSDQWTLHKNPQDYSRFFLERWEADLTHFITRDRNHPSIVMWSIGNEIPKANFEDGAAIGRMLKAKVQELDSTRPVTEAITNMLVHGGMDNSYHYFDVLDVCGYNYGDHYMDAHHAQYPQRIMYGSETFPNMIYHGWRQVTEHPYVIGDFVWTAMDYLGEVNTAFARYVEQKMYLNWQKVNGIPMGFDASMFFDMVAAQTVSAWPCYTAWCGDIDLVGQKKPQSRYRDVVWDEQAIEMNVHEPIPAGLEEEISFWGWPLEYNSWTWSGCEGQALQVRVFTKAPQVRLELNGQTVGEKALTEADEYIATFSVDYQPGTLTAIALASDGTELGRKELTTAGQAVAIRLTADRTAIEADRSDLAYILIEAVDQEGRTVPVSDLKVNISVSGNGELIGSGSANGADMQSFNRPTVQLYRGQALAIVRPQAKAGSIGVQVSADGLPTATATIAVN